MLSAYQTVHGDGCDSFTEKRSRFIGYARPVKTVQEASDFIEEIRKKHWDAKHNVFAYILRDGGVKRYSDDGEPQGTAGVPVLDVLEKEQLTDIAVVVTRYFGGVLLGTGGLVRAYSHGAKLAVSAAGIVTMGPCSILQLETDYAFYQRLLTLLPDYGVRVQASDFTDTVALTLSVAAEKEAEFCSKIFDASDGRFRARKIGENFAEI